MRRQSAHQRLDGAGRRHGVRIHQQHVVALRRADAEVVRLGESKVAARVDHLHRRPALAHVRRGAVRRRVVDDGDGGRERARCGRRATAGSASISSTELKVTMMMARLSLSANGGLLEDRQRRGRGALPVVARQHVAGVAQHAPAARSSFVSRSAITPAISLVGRRRRDVARRARRRFRARPRYRARPAARLPPAPRAASSRSPRIRTETRTPRRADTTPPASRSSTYERMVMRSACVDRAAKRVEIEPRPLASDSRRRFRASRQAPSRRRASNDCDQSIDPAPFEDRADVRARSDRDRPDDRSNDRERSSGCDNPKRYHAQP